ncbi:Tn3 family transposase, partial [Enterobacter hormaechei subsp. hoffmannii]|nr:Tn3 family transposase [Enterobacter hormaechei]HED1598941.1 Tn3 family transposase [Enterobacter cloacae subsp. cloacae]HED2542102.1 Tn3 family transposase [Enterobacter cloacae subsp. cloacae]
AATMTAGKIRPSQLLRKLASYPRQNNLAVALREVGGVSPNRRKFRQPNSSPATIASRSII